MARREVDVTTDWVEISTLPAIITILKENFTDTGSKILFNDTNSDIAAHIIIPGNKGLQITQHSIKSTYVRATIAGWRIIVDD